MRGRGLLGSAAATSRAAHEGHPATRAHPAVGLDAAEAQDCPAALQSSGGAAGRAHHRRRRRSHPSPLAAACPSTMAAHFHAHATVTLQESRQQAGRSTIRRACARERTWAAAPVGGGAAAARGTATRITRSWRLTPLTPRWSSCTRSGAQLGGRAAGLACRWCCSDEVCTAPAPCCGQGLGASFILLLLLLLLPPPPIAEPSVLLPNILGRATTRESALSTLVGLMATYRYDDCAFRCEGTGWVVAQALPFAMPCPHQDGA